MSKQFMPQINEVGNIAKGFEKIKPKGNMSLDDAKYYIDNLLKGEPGTKNTHIDDREQHYADDSRQNKYDAAKSEVHENDNNEKDIEQKIKDYMGELKETSEYPETISDDTIDVSDVKVISLEDNKEMREEFNEKKGQLKREWEKTHGIPWPKYEKDVYSEKGNLIRKVGDDYDVHHIQPLKLGGKNEVSNVTPLHADLHYDKQGVHRMNGALDKLSKSAGGINQ